MKTNDGWLRKYRAPIHPVSCVVTTSPVFSQLAITITLTNNDRYQLPITMTPDEADELADKLRVHADMARRGRVG